MKGGWPEPRVDLGDIGDLESREEYGLTKDLAYDIGYVSASFGDPHRCRKSPTSPSPSGGPPQIGFWSDEASSTSRQ